MRKQRASANPALDTSAESCYSLANGARTSRDALESPCHSSRPPVDDCHGFQRSEGNAMPFDTLTLYKIWSETDRRLDSLAASVREGMQVDEASNFARWLRFSNILKLLEPFEQDVPLPIRARELARKCDDLVSACGEWYAMHERSNKPRDAYVSRSALAAIENDLRLIKETLRLPSTATADAVDSAEAALHVLPGA